MSSPLNSDFSEAIVDALEQSELKSRLNRIWLGGAAGPNGGQGQRPGGFIGQLIQSLTAYDTTEAATLSGSNNLVDNLNHIRYRLSILETFPPGGGNTHIHGSARWALPSGISQLEIPDYAYEILSLSNSGLIVDPVNYTLSNYTTIILDTPTISDSVFTAQYILLQD